MEASPLTITTTENWLEQLDQSLSFQRDRIREFLDAQQQRLQGAESQLDQQLQQLANEMACDRSELRQAKEEADQRSQQLTRQAQTLASLKEELGSRRTEWEQLQQQAGRQQEAWAGQIRQQQERLDRCREELAERQSEIDAAEAEQHDGRQALELARREHQAELEQLAALREELEAKRAEHANLAEQLAAGQADTQRQRRHLARELKARHAQQLKELEHRRAELQRRDTRQQSELQQQLEAARAEQQQLATQLQASQKRAEDAEAELKSLQGKYDQLRQEQARRPDGGTGAEALRSVEAERDALLARLSEAESRLAESQGALAEARETGAGGGVPAGGSADDDARRRYEMVLEDLRALKAQNAELQSQLAQARSATLPARAAGGALNWEAQKQRLLAALEADFDENNKETKAERLKIEEVVRETDRMLAEKDQECRELKQLLQQQSASLGSVAVGAAALGEAIDSDAVVQEERQKLKDLQDQWREKLRQAEIDVSIERAKLAREKAQIEEKLVAIGKRAGPPEGETGQSPAPPKPARGRWLERLGLKDASDE